MFSSLDSSHSHSSLRPCGQCEHALVKDKQSLATIPAASVTEISYRQDVHRRVEVLWASESSRWE